MCVGFGRGTNETVSIHTNLIVYFISFVISSAAWAKKLLCISLLIVLIKIYYLLHNNKQVIFLALGFYRFSPYFGYFLIRNK